MSTGQNKTTIHKNNKELESREIGIAITVCQWDENIYKYVKANNRETVGQLIKREFIGSQWYNVSSRCYTYQNIGDKRVALATCLEDLNDINLYLNGKRTKMKALRIVFI